MRKKNIAPAIAIMHKDRMLLVKKGPLWMLPHGDIGKDSIDSVCVRLQEQFPNIVLCDPKYYGDFENDVLVKYLAVYHASMKNPRRIPLCDVRAGVAWMNERQYFDNSFELSTAAYHVYRWLRGYELVEK